MKFRKRTLNQIADMICGNDTPDGKHFRYRSSSYITEFFEDCGTGYKHDGSTRSWWVANTLEQIMEAPTPDPGSPPRELLAVIRELMDPSDAVDEGHDRSGALAALNAALAREGFEAFYGNDGLCHVRNLKTRAVAGDSPNPQRPLTKDEQERRALLAAYLDGASEDDLTELILLPLFRQLGFQRVTVAGHKDKALEYGKDVWMKFRLPTLHNLYFGIQAKRGKLDSAGKSKADNANVAEVLAQVRMMLGHMVFDPETNRRSLVDHAIIVAGGEITKAAKNWIGEQLDASHRSQILFMDRDDILDLHVVNNLPLPRGAGTKGPRFGMDEIPF